MVVVLVSKPLPLPRWLANGIPPVFVVVWVAFCDDIAVVKGVLVVPLQCGALDLDLGRGRRRYWIFGVLDCSPGFGTDDIMQYAVVVEFLNQPTVVDCLPQVSYE